MMRLEGIQCESEEKTRGAFKKRKGKIELRVTNVVGLMSLWQR